MTEADTFSVFNVYNFKDLGLEEKCAVCIHLRHDAGDILLFIVRLNMLLI
jgi:hypothetical protein